MRREVDALADRLRAHAAELPVAYFAEWADHWSMGDSVDRWLAPAVAVSGDRYALYGYSLPDGGALARRLADAGPQQFAEGDWLVRRLREAVEYRQELCDPATLIVLRRVTGPSVSDEDVPDSLGTVPAWLTGPGN